MNRKESERSPVRIYRGGAALRAFRLGAGFGLREAARLAGMSAGHLSDLETGKRLLTNDMVARVANALVGGGKR